MSEEIYRPGMGADIQEIGEEGLNHFRKTLKFGDIIENGWASEKNPHKFGIVVKARGHSINCTDGSGKFWDLVFDAGTKIKLHGNVLNNNYEKVKNDTNSRNSTGTP
jgi:hypothetical protein